MFIPTGYPAVKGGLKTSGEKGGAAEGGDCGDIVFLERAEIANLCARVCVCVCVSSLAQAHIPYT